MSIAFNHLDAITSPSAQYSTPSKSVRLVVHRKWHANACADDSEASSCGCVALGMPDVMTNIPTNRCQNKTQDTSICTQAGVHNWELTTVSLVTRGGIALLGELSKVATVSAARFRSIQEGGDGGLRVTVWASAGEKLEISFVYNVPANPTVKTWRLLIAPGATAGGAATVTIGPAGSLIASQ